MMAHLSFEPGHLQDLVGCGPGEGVGVQHGIDAIFGRLQQQQAVAGSTTIHVNEGREQDGARQGGVDMPWSTG